MIFARVIAHDQLGLVAICVTVLSMFEAAGEVGIRFSVIQNKTGDRYDYLNAAWWFQAARALLLTAAVGVKLIAEQPVHTIETNIHGTEVVLDAANKFCKKVLIASTSEVYGKSEMIPFHEDDDTVLGSTRFSRWSYACSKAIDEFLALAYHQQFGLQTVVVRLFNTIGPRQTGQYGMVVPRFVEKALKNEPLEIYGTGHQTRCFCCVLDVIGALVDLMACPTAPGRVYNLGSDREISLIDLADMVIGLTQSKSRKVFMSYEQAYGRPFDDMLRRVPSLERIHQTIGFKPKYSLEDTLTLVIKEIKSRQ